MDSSAINGIRRTMRWLLERGCKRKEVSSAFLENGSNLLEGLSSASNCKYDTPYRNFGAKEIIDATNNFKEIVMSDGTGVLFRGSFQHRLVLVKRYRTSGLLRDFPSFMINDIVNSLMISRHNNVLRLLGCCLDFEAPVLVYECTGQDRLLDGILYMRKDPAPGLPRINRLKVASDVAYAIEYLHSAFSAPVIHRDLNTRNIVIDRFGVVKLLDFSLCISLPVGETQVEDAVVGTTRYLEPEYIRTGIVTEKTGVYMFGLLLLRLLTGKIIVDLQDECFSVFDGMQDHIENNRLNKILDHINLVESGETDEEQLQHLAELVFRCTRYKGEDRPNMIDVARELRSIERSSRLC